MFDVIPSSEKETEVVQEDPEMVKFQTMLSDYLSSAYSHSHIYLHV